MIITCPCGEKRFEVADNLIPKKGRLLKCGSCDETWFFNKSNVEKKFETSAPFKAVAMQNKEDVVDDLNEFHLRNDAQKKLENNENKITKENNKQFFSFSSFLSLLLVIIISFIALLIFIDTFKTPLFTNIQGLEVLMFNFYETLKDIKLFIVDLILND
tara:strand:- start:200 stop:676 length:477 start_codon:yes stop_codon:yes gene_type:complete